MAPSLPARPAWRPDIEGLRGLAVALVVCFHAGLPLFRGAFIAVDVFFVLSGFFLTRTLTRYLADGGDIDLTEVYARRVWRLLPTMAVVLVATIAMALLLYAPIDRAAVAENMRPVAFFAGNLIFAADGVNYFSAGENPLLHTWTLGVEYQLVLIFPVVVMLLAWIGKRRAAHVESDSARHVMIMRTVFWGIMIVGALSFALSVWSSSAAPMWAYFGPHTRLWAFAAGGVMAFLVGAGQSVFRTSTNSIATAQVVGIAAIVVPAFVYDRSMSYPGLIALVPVGGTVLILAGGAAAAETAIGRALASAPLSWLGRISYPL
ncbi:MAG: acyltransferase, partial [Gemmatimonas sp.]